LDVPIRKDLLALNHTVKIRWHVRQHEKYVVKLRRVHGRKIDQLQQVLMLQTGEEPYLPQDALAVANGVLDMFHGDLETRSSDIITQVNSTIRPTTKLANHLEIARKTWLACPARHLC
jgi:phage/plasmid-associated DNA primase